MNTAERNDLVVANLPLVGFLVSDWCSRASHLPREDLASAGTIGLVEASRRYDPTRGIEFGAYARRRILGAMADELRSQSWIPRKAWERATETRKVESALQAALGRDPSTAEVANAMGVGVSTARKALHDARVRVVSLHTPGVDVDEQASDLSPSPDDAVMAEELTLTVRRAVETLPERMRHVVEQIYFHGRSVGEVAEEMGLTHSAVSHTRIEAVALLREGLQVHYPDSDAQVVELSPKVSATRRKDYLRALGQRAAGGLSRPEVPAEPLARAS